MPSQWFCSFLFILQWHCCTCQDITGSERNDQVQAWWLEPVILALWEAKASWSLEPRSLRPAWSRWQNSMSTKKYKNYLGVVAYAYGPSYLGGWGGRLTRAWEVEAAVSRDRATAFHPGQQSKTLEKKTIHVNLRERERNRARERERERARERQRETERESVCVCLCVCVCVCASVCLRWRDGKRRKTMKK